MIRPATTLPLALALTLVTVAPSIAALPSPVTSTYPPCLVTCPMGDIHYVIVVRDAASVPVAGAAVVLDFLHCPGAFLCPQRPFDPYVVDPIARTIRMTTDATGTADFPLRVGGVCDAGGVFLIVDGVFFRTYALASPDQNGTGAVIALFGSDLPTFTAKVGTGDPTADFDCSGLVDASDQLIFGQHISHSCDGFVDPAQRRSWGSVKQHYR